MRVAVVSSVYGNYDRPAPPPEQDHDAEWIMVSDREHDCPPWKVIVEPRPLVHPRLAAKVAKARPDLYADADVWIWIDANMRISCTDFVSWCLAGLGSASLALTPHQWAATMSAELGLAAPLDKYAGVPMAEQVAHYRERGFPDDWGNWWTGLMVRTPGCRNFGDAWLAEMLRWGYEDQLSLPWVLRQQGLRPRSLVPGWPERFGWSQHNAEAAWGQR
jgi:hypothetical protein